MRTLIVACVCACAVWAARAEAPDPTADQILEKSIAASGGREKISKLTSSYTSGTIEFVNVHGHGKVEMYAKAPNKQLVVTFLEGVGEVKQGFDGQVAWSQDPSGTISEVTGAPLEELKRTAFFNAQLKWREKYKKVERAGDGTVDGRKAWVVRLTPAAGTPSTQYFDQENFMLLKETGTRDIPGQGEAAISVEYSDYRDVGGIKMPFRIKQVVTPKGREDQVMEVTLTEAKNNPPIDDSVFAKPVPSALPGAPDEPGHSK